MQDNGFVISDGVGILKQPKAEFDPQDIGHRFIQQLLCQHAGFDQAFQMMLIALRDHLHVYPGGEGFDGHFPLVGAKAVGYHLGHRVPVADHKAVKAPFAA